MIKKTYFAYILLIKVGRNDQPADGIIIVFIHNKEIILQNKKSLNINIKQKSCSINSD